MDPYYKDNTITVYNKPCNLMDELPDESVQMVVTSPPYWGLRKYAGEQDLIWGNHNGCIHEWVTERTLRGNGAGGLSNKQMLERKGAINFQQSVDYSDRATYANSCSKCGAWRGSFGLEPTPELYIAHSIEILSEIHRVLRKDGVVFWNLGDSYSGSGGTGNQFGQIEKGIGMVKPQKPSGVLKPKDLCLIPFRFAIAAQEAGWWIRSVIIWNKNNPMPESCNDRPTESHEYIFLLTKSANYYWDQEAVREKQSENTHSKGVSPSTTKNFTEKSDGSHKDWHEYTPDTILANGRNIRSVWTFSTQPYKEAHFATFPEALPERCIKAGTPEYGCCNKCRTPYERIVESNKTPRNELSKDDPRYRPNRYVDNKYADELRDGFECGMYKETKTTGWQPGCKCTDTSPVPSVVLEPFAGSGTTLWVSKKLGRKAIGYEISKEYCELIVDRNRQLSF